jgi:hypothetical protein
MRTIILSLSEFLNFKKIYKGKFQSSKVINNQIVISANDIQLSELGY